MWQCSGDEVSSVNPHTELVMEWGDVSIVFNRDLEKAGMWQYSDFLLEKAKKQELLVHCGGEQLGASSHLGQ